ncbi:hypothetical protein EZV62_015907 [Acer yangbiense]|uniref:RNase H type-1 domain-containing protein n=1 Tax=Acer yangbiense TaxID=1000413 RepID=A0A5C7HMU2_9ROSI|nr:hypothetical protein EZV62_015907 [Acer yangbiense]
MSSGGSSDKERTLGESSGRDSDERFKKHMASSDFLKGRSGCSETASSLKDRAVLLERFNPVKPSKIERKENMCVDGPLSGQIVEVMVEAQEAKKDAIVDQSTSLVTAEFGSVLGQTEKAQCNTSGRPEISNQSLSLGLAEGRGPSILAEDLRAKMDICTQHLSAWSKSRFGDIRRKIEDKYREIECLYKRCRETSVMRKIKSLERKDIFCLFSSTHPIDDLNLFCMIVWSIWDSRNLVSILGKEMNPDQVISKAENLLFEFHKSIDAVSPVVGPSSRPNPCGDWVAPPPGWLKLNSAVVSKSSSRSSLLGTVIRDDKGKIIAARARKIKGFFSKETGVLLSLREGLLLAKFLEVPVGMVEVDFSPVISILFSSGQYLGDASFVIRDIKALMADIGVRVCQVTSPVGNSLARNLGKSAFSSSREGLLLDVNILCKLFNGY